MSVYKKGSSGETVKQIQSALGLTPDGVFGIGTETAVKKFQKDHGLVPDGIVGEKTLSVLLKNESTVIKPSFGIDKSGLGIISHLLPKTEYLNGVYKNEYIILHHTAGHDCPETVIDDWARDTQGRIATEFVIGGQRSTDGRSLYDGRIVRAYPEGNQAYHIGKCGSTLMATHSTGIELCNMGWVKNGKSYVNTKVLPEQIVKLTSPFRGYTDWHKYSDKQLSSLRDLLLYIAKRDNVDLHRGIYEWIKKEGVVKAFDYHQEAFDGKVKGLLTHANIRKDKFDMSPQPNLVDMILSL